MLTFFKLLDCIKRWILSREISQENKQKKKNNNFVNFEYVEKFILIEI